ncbi:hypothetical protein Tco_0475149 [Tanacetum coccineum]
MERQWISNEILWCTRTEKLRYMIRLVFKYVHKESGNGIGVSDDEVSSMASVIGCEAAKFPFKYLGVPVGCNMSRCSYWNDILQKFVTKLSAWKARMLSVGGRLSLIKSVLGKN